MYSATRQYNDTSPQSNIGCQQFKNERLSFDFVRFTCQAKPATASRDTPVSDCEKRHSLAFISSFNSSSKTQNVLWTTITGQ